VDGGGGPQAWSSKSISSTTWGYLGAVLVGLNGMSTLCSVLVSELKLILPSYIDEECFVAVDVELCLFDFVDENIEGIVMLKVGE